MRASRCPLDFEPVDAAAVDGRDAFGGAEQPSGLHLLPRADDATSGEEGEEGGGTAEPADQD